MFVSSATNQAKPNRRLADRIYEHSNLFYRKIERDGSESGFNQLLQASTTDTSLPTSQSLEQDTLKVNLSATGIAFTSREALNPGDHLLLRILLLSNLTTIMTACRVVYCKPSNPYENDRYPFQIGGQFVNLSVEDSELLNRHVQRKRKQQLALNLSLLTMFSAILFYPLETLHLATALAHHLMEIVLHGLHLVFEYLEMSLDHVIEHLFHTGLHETQVIVFYTLLVFALTAMYFLGRKLPAYLRGLINRQRLFWSRKQASARYFWSEQTPIDRIKIIGLSLAAISAYVYFGLI